MDCHLVVVSGMKLIENQLNAALRTIIAIFTFYYALNL